MLRAMDELEKAVNVLLDRLQGHAGRGPGPKGTGHPDPVEKGEARERDAAELVRRAIKRLQSL